VERNREAGQNPPRVVEPSEEEEEGSYIYQLLLYSKTAYCHRQSPASMQVMRVQVLNEYGVCGRSLPGIAGPNLSSGMDVFLL
jgi:hypothetical protein